jgi:hypothetical protein
VLEGVMVAARGAGLGLGWHAQVVARRRGNGKAVKRGRIRLKEEMGRERLAISDLRLAFSKSLAFFPTGQAWQAGQAVKREP